MTEPITANNNEFLRDIVEQPDAIANTADSLAADKALLNALRDLRQRHDAVVLTGMGSSHTTLYPLHLRLIEAGMPAVLIEASELLHYGARGLGPRTLLVLVSQSGETVEIVRILDAVAGKTTVVGVTNEPESALARRADVTVLLRAGVEAFVSSKTYVASLTALWIAGSALLGESVDDAGLQNAARELKALIDRRDEVTSRIVDVLGEQPTELFLIGRGPSYASALTGALILKEASHTPAEPLSGGHFRHGPLEMVSDHTSVLAFAPSGRTSGLIRGIAGEIAGYGGRVALVGPVDASLPGADLPLVETPALDESLAPMVDIVAAELYALALATARGHQAGAAFRMGKVTREE